MSVQTAPLRSRAPALPSAAPQRAAAEQQTRAAAPRSAGRLPVIPAGLALLAGLAVLSLFVGSGDLPAAQTAETLRAWIAGELPPESRGTAELLVLERRLPRTALALAAGAALGAAGVVMQALARNPLADPGLLGVNAGAYTAVVFGSAVMGPSVGTGHVWLAVLGALITATAVYVIGTSGTMGANPAKLVLTGVAIGAVLSGVSFAVTLAMPEVFDRVRFWSAGSLQGRGSDDVTALLPFLAVGLLIALFLPRALNALALGDDAASALGARPGLTRLAGLISVTLLCGAATAAAGPLSFIGLMVPHALRMLVGPDHRWLLPLSLLAAPALLLVADILARVAAPSELPAGVVTAFLGAPMLIWLTRRRAVREL
ncbi:iron ABC transporter permease [Nesterenkonia sp. NBAIMH1]|uniref:FecCD family ABC transporter permease n=1 Tax=Nesterenkonia sp. NBAIMH1 TaxID=2600320 RepID=UPI0011B82067|nr:iron chelate uptake ABC transporter family permease subunit [Nesterenkonia sp. NBAIMH1]